jgi:putative inorganic carbon (HCO3(-)) transporter
MSKLFGIYLVLLIIRPQEFVLALADVPLLQVLLLACLAMWVLARDKRLSLPPFVLVGCLFIFAPLTVGMNGWWGGVPAALGRLDPVIAIFLVASMAARELRALHAYMWIILVCACVLVGYSAVQLHTEVGPWTGIVPLEGRPYYLGIFSDPNDLGQLFVIALAFALYLLSTGRQGLAWLFLWSSVGWLLYGTILTNSRGALLATLTLFALDAWRRFGKIAAGVGAVLAVPALLAVTRLSQLSAGEVSAHGRLQAWYEGIQLLKSNPVFGVGFGSFGNYNDLTAHNSIILPMAELGIPGLTMWLGIMWYSIRMLWWVGYGPHAKSDKNQKHKGNGGPSDEAVRREILAGRGLLMAFIGFGVGAFFLSQSYKAPLFLLCGFAAARFAAATSVLPDPPSYRLLPDVMRLGGVTIACIIGMYLTVKIAI